ncbi:MAG: CDGSH iron-sulfur domain-containing protein [Betaproteobacteria bacterium]|nr:CDGSH iron-sulfur domain-containing protein [Betaproteobacteria bacterium]
MSDPRQTPKIACLSNGPYYLLHDMTPAAVPNLCREGGEPCATVRGVALCRCGASKNKPFCDGTHGTIGFKDRRVTEETQNRRVDYAGKRITIHDNRGICSHAGFCTEGLKSVFRMGEEPWIDPDGASAEEIIETVKKCPSGALSYSIENVEYRDQDREPMVTVTDDGPYAITGGIELIGVPFGEGASKEHYTLCRCGASKNKPFCDGSHWEVEFTDPVR